MASEAQLREAAQSAARLHELPFKERKLAEPQLLQAILPQLPGLSARLIWAAAGFRASSPRRFASAIRNPRHI